MPDTTYSAANAYHYGSFVQAAYNMFVSDEKNLHPPAQDLPAGYQIVLYLTAVDHFVDDTERVFYGFIAQSTMLPTEYVIAIRGTKDFIEWLIDAEFCPTEFVSVPNSGKVEDGFYSVYKTLAGLTPDGQSQDVNSFVKNTVCGQRLICVGHSLGSAIANMLSLDMAVNDAATDLTLYALAPPKTGDGTFQTVFNQRVPHSYQICNEPDIVPKVPPLYKSLNAIEEIDSKNFPKVKHSLGCYHALTTYLYTLNQESSFSLGTCDKTPPQA